MVSSMWSIPGKAAMNHFKKEEILCMHIRKSHPLSDGKPISDSQATKLTNEGKHICRNTTQI